MQHLLVLFPRRWRWSCLLCFQSRLFGGVSFLADTGRSCQIVHPERRIGSMIIVLFVFSVLRMAARQSSEQAGPVAMVALAATKNRFSYCYFYSITFAWIILILFIIDLIMVILCHYASFSIPGRIYSGLRIINFDWAYYVFLMYLQLRFCSFDWMELSGLGPPLRNHQYCAPSASMVFDPLP